MSQSTPTVSVQEAQDAIKMNVLVSLYKSNVTSTQDIETNKKVCDYYTQMTGHIFPLLPIPSIHPITESFKAAAEKISKELGLVEIEGPPKPRKEMRQPPVCLHANHAMGKNSTFKASVEEVAKAVGLNFVQHPAYDYSPAPNDYIFVAISCSELKRASDRDSAITSQVLQSLRPLANANGFLLVEDAQDATPDLQNALKSLMETKKLNGQNFKDLSVGFTLATTPTHSADLSVLNYIFSETAHAQLQHNPPSHQEQIRKMREKSITESDSLNSSFKK